ncbi:hypothetical protein [Anaerotignum lactatifermentans]|uniref:hypothetical protein n=1 Tax=Anaerotignum lactatifermentans TaxID=160404 RepID=UPI00255CF1A2|nr:hypothetical protein [Anaerotignum lactatifermentans]
MKKRIFLLCCVVGVMMPTAVYGQGVPVTNAIVEQSNMYEGTVIQLQDLDTGRCYYLTQPAAVEDFLTEWKNAWLTGKSAELSHDMIVIDFMCFLMNRQTIRMYSMWCIQTRISYPESLTQRTKFQTKL